MSLQPETWVAPLAEGLTFIGVVIGALKVAIGNNAVTKVTITTHSQRLDSHDARFTKHNKRIAKVAQIASRNSQKYALLDARTLSTNQIVTRIDENVTKISTAQAESRGADQARQHPR